MRRLPEPPRGHGRWVPEWVDTQDPEAMRGTQKIRVIDRNLFVGWDRSKAAFVIYGPSIRAKGWIPLVVCQDDYGVPYRCPVPWDVICLSLLKAREGELACDIANQRNDERMNREAELLMDRNREIARYAAGAVASEIAGNGRFDGRDLTDAVQCADEGRTKTEPRHKIVSVGGRPARTTR